MTGQRVTYDVDADGYNTESIDEIVLDGRIHLEMLADTAAFLSVSTGDEERQFNVWAAPTTRVERRKRLRLDQDRLVDHLGSLLPWRWRTGHPRACLWSVPIHKRPAAAVRDWWEARRYAGVALTVTEEES